MSMICLAYQGMQQKLTRQLIFFNAQKITYALVYFFFHSFHTFLSYFEAQEWARLYELKNPAPKCLDLSFNTDIYVNIASM